MEFEKMQNRTWSRIVAAAAAVVLAGGSLASAAFTLTPGTSQTPNGNSAGFLNDYYNGNEAYQTSFTSPQEYASQDLGGNQTYDLKFTIQTTVYKNTVSGTMDFVYELDNISDNNGSTTFGDTVTRLSLQSFAGFGVNADYESGTGQIFGFPADVAPLTDDRSSAPGTVVGFNFPTDSSSGNAMTPGSYSDYLIVRTDSTGFVFGTASVIGGNSTTGPIQVPGQILLVPEPASIGLVVVATSLQLGRRRRAVR